MLGDLVRTISAITATIGFVTIAMCDITLVDRPGTTATNSFYVSNRPPLDPSPFTKMSSRAFASLHGSWS